MVALVSQDRKKTRKAYLTEWREMRGVPLAAVAKAMGTTEAEMARIEAGEGICIHPVIHLVPIANAIGVKASMLFRKPTAFDEITKRVRIR